MKKRTSRYSNAYDDPKAVKSKLFGQGILGLGMTPWEVFNESLLAQKMSERYNWQDNKNFYCIHHARIDKKGLKIPDISFWELDGNGDVTTPVVVIEIDDKKGNSAAAKKCVDAIKNHGIKEAFLLNSETLKWRRFTQRGEAKTRTSRSITLGIDLKTLL